jgi:hypothetical protein
MNPNITVIDIKNNDNPFLDLRQMKQLFIVTHFIAGMDPEKVWPVKSYLIEENTRSNVVVRTPVPVVDCSEATQILEELGIKLKGREYL